MGEDPRDVEQRIENTSERMGDAVEALSAKADVPGRVKGYVEDKKDAVTSKVSGAKEKVTGAAGSTGDGGSQVCRVLASGRRPLEMARRYLELLRRAVTGRGRARACPGSPARRRAAPRWR